MTYKQAKSRAGASLRSIIGKDYTEECDGCRCGIDNGRIKWMGLSFITLDGRFLCRECRAGEAAASQLVAKDCGRHFGASGGRCAKCELHDGYRRNGFLQYGGTLFTSVICDAPSDSLQERAIRSARSPMSKRLF